MINLAKLKKMITAETAADEWWDGLSKTEQQAYVKAHPKSKYAKKVASPPSMNSKLQKATIKSIPSIPSATKMSNHLVKHYGFKKNRFMTSNPYDKTQMFAHSGNKKDVQRLESDLLNQGWKKEKNNFLIDGYHGSYYNHPDGGSIGVTHSKGKEKSTVNVYGNKKFKQSTIPYYD